LKKRLWKCKWFNLLQKWFSLKWNWSK
jgi:hypothetical protein